MKEEHELIIYKDVDGRLTEEKIVDYGDRKEELEEAFRIKVSYKNAKVLDIDSTRELFVLYDDNGLCVYNVKENSSHKINLLNKYDNYSMLINDELNKIIGIFFYKKDSLMYYDIIENKTIPIVIDGYDNFTSKSISEKYLSLRTSKTGSNYTFLFNLETGNVDLENESTFPNAIVDYEILKYKDQYMIFLWTQHNYYNGYLKIYNSNLNLIYESSEEQISENYVSFSDGYLYINDNGIINKYDMSGNLIFSSEKYNNIKKIISSYVVYVENNNLVFKSIDNNESFILTKWNDNWKIDDNGLKFLSQKKMHISGNEELEDTCITIDYGKEYNGKDPNVVYGMNYCYNSGKQIIEYPIKDETID